MADEAEEESTEIIVTIKAEVNDQPASDKSETIKLENTSNQEEKLVLKRKNELSTEKTPKKRRKKIIVQEESSSSEEECYSITVSNLPKEWSFMEIKNYFDTECDTVDEMEMLSPSESGERSVELTFISLEKCKKALRCLKDKVVKGNKLEVKTRGTHGSDDTNNKNTSATENEVEAEKSPGVAVNWDPKDYELYGLQPQFLKSLGIVPPLSKWVHVTNFRCDKSELRNVLELAGNVLVLTVVTISRKYAKVMYSHPLEAVQAISMLNDQFFYGSRLSVSLEINSSDAYVLPKGLTNIGLGLGVHGKPIRNIEKQYRKFIKKQESSINPLLFVKTNNDIKTECTANHTIIDEEIKKQIDELIVTAKDPSTRLFQVKCIDDVRDSSNTDLVKETVKTKVGPQKPKPLLNSSTNVSVRLSQPSPNRNPFPQASSRPQFRPGFNPRPGPYGSGPNGPNYGPQLGPFGPGPMNSGPMGMNSGPMGMNSGPMGMNSGPMGMNTGNMINPAMQQQGNFATTVQFYNLPPSTTFPLLCDKLSQCGQVLSVRLTTPGCAVATFAQRSFADRCYQMFNGMNVEGYVLAVQIM